MIKIGGECWAVSQNGGVAMEERELISRLKEGDTDAFGKIYSLYADKALKTAYLIVNDKFLAEDIVQEVFISILKSVKGLKKPEAFGAWLYRFLIRYSWKACGAKRRVLPRDFGDKTEEISGRDEYFEDEKYRTLYESIDRLTPKLRTVVVLHYFNDMTVKEIAEVTGCLEGTIKSRLHTARKRLREVLKEGVSI